MIHQLEDGDILKILPMIIKDKVIWGRQYKQLYTGEKFIYDNTDEDYFSKINYKIKTLTPWIESPFISIRVAFNCFINNEIKIVVLGRKLIKMLSENEPFCVSDNKHLFIKKEIIYGNIPLPCYDNSFIGSHDWKKPKINTNSKEEWSAWIKNNQPNFEGFLEKNNIFNNINELKTLFGNAISEVISENRDKKINEILK
jgi:hypothetical protein